MANKSYLILNYLRSIWQITVLFFDFVKVNEDIGTIFAYSYNDDNETSLREECRNGGVRDVLPEKRDAEG
jgi:hypothetical protein